MPKRRSSSDYMAFNFNAYGGFVDLTAGAQIQSGHTCERRRCPLGQSLPRLSGRVMSAKGHSLPRVGLFRQPNGGCAASSDKEFPAPGLVTKGQSQTFNAPLAQQHFPRRVVVRAWVYEAPPNKRIAGAVLSRIHSDVAQTSAAGFFRRDR